MKRRSVQTVLVAFGLLIACALPGLAAKGHYRARLIDADQASRGIAHPQAVVHFRLSNDASRLRYRIVMNEAMPLPSMTLRLAPAGRTGAIVAVLRPGPASLGRAGRMVAKGRITPNDLFGPMIGQPLDALLAAMEGRYVHVSVDTGRPNGGELEGWTR